MKAQTVKVQTRGTITNVFVDGKEIHHITAMNFRWRVDDIPRLFIEMFAMNLEIDAEEIEIEQIEKDGDK